MREQPSRSLDGERAAVAGLPHPAAAALRTRRHTWNRAVVTSIFGAQERFPGFGTPCAIAKDQQSQEHLRSFKMIPTAITTLFACNFPTGFAGVLLMFFCLGVMLVEAMITYVIPIILFATVAGGGVLLLQTDFRSKEDAIALDNATDYE
jgi:hypothetical protein